MKKVVKKPAKKMQDGGKMSLNRKAVEQEKKASSPFLMKQKKDSTEARLKKVTPKAKKGGSFPDLNKDGKITKADILKGRGVIAKKGAKVKADGMKKCKYGCK